MAASLYQTAGVAMDTLISIQLVTPAPERQARAAMQRALAWFETVERACSRFDSQSELRKLLQQVDQPVQASPVLFEAVQFALWLAQRPDGAFDPTVGKLLEAHGFLQNYRTGERIESGPEAAGASYRDLRLSPARRTIRLRRPLVLDLGAVAKGLAIDLAGCELGSGAEGFCVEAGGDLLTHGHNPDGQPWRVGVRDPLAPDALATTLAVSGQAVCTSGGYERRTADGQGHHLLDPRSGHSARELASVTVVAPTAMAADGLATAAFILGPRRGLRLLEEEGVGGLLITPAGQSITTGRLTPC